jgi:hypothetical protein
MQKMVFNTLKTGFILGVLLPLISLTAFYLFRYNDIPVSEFLRFIYFRDILSPLLSLNILPNLILFFIFIRTDSLFSARGVLLATFLFAGLVIIFKVIS